MRTLVRFPTAELLPSIGEVLAAQGLPGEGELPPRLRPLVEDAFTAYDSLAEPRAVYEEVTPQTFAAVLAPLAPPSEAPVVARVAAGARALALYVATLGPALPDRIRRLFGENALAEGYMLDAVASAGADLLSERLAEHFAGARRERGATNDEHTLAYSPGYCGWPTSGQRELFAALAPVEVAVALSDSCLMTPIKSVSGVLVAAPAEAHLFRPDFPYCRDCRSRSCGRRMAPLRTAKRSASAPTGAQ